MDLEEVLAPHIDDEDIIEYIASLLEDNPECDEDLRETVLSLISGAVDDDEELAEKLLCSILPSGSNDDVVTSVSEDVYGTGVTVKKLEKSLCIQDQIDIDGEEAVDEFGLSKRLGGKISQEGADIQDFYANMIDIRTEEIVSQRAKRKEAQRKLREKQEEEDRLRAIRDVMEMAMNAERDDEMPEDAIEFDDNFADVHLKSFNLPNKRGSGPDLLTDANLILARGRRYGLLGRNGCGKTTLLELVSQRGITGIPRNISMLLVRQEIVGNDLTPGKLF